MLMPLLLFDADAFTPADTLMPARHATLLTRAMLMPRRYMRALPMLLLPFACACLRHAR